MQTSHLYDGAVTIDFDEAEHVYHWREKGYPVDGVTSILKLLDKPAIGPWMVKCAVEFIQAKLFETDIVPSKEKVESILKESKGESKRLAQDAADIGKLVHAYAEQSLIGEAPELPANAKAKRGAQAFDLWMAENEVEPLFVERVVMSRTWYYAGKLDLFANVRGRKAIVDFKSSSGLYLEMLLQVGGYAVAMEEEFGNPIDDAWVVRLDKQTGKFEPYHIPITNAIRDGFIAVRVAEDKIARVKDILDGIREQRAA